VLAFLSLVPLAFAGRVDRLTDLQHGGADTEVVETIDKWEKAGGLGDEAAALLALRDRSALTLALAAHTAAALTAYRQAYPRSTLLDEALHAEWDRAFAEAQAEGTPASMRAYVAAYPNSSFRAQAVAVEAGLAYQEATEAGSADAIAAFLHAHPETPYAATAWESVAARTPGIYLRLADGLPHVLAPVPIADGHFAFPTDPVRAPPRPTVAVNLPGTGRGATSEWWGLFAVGADGRIDAVPPVARLLGASIGAVPPGMLDLFALPGTHAARVAAPEQPLVVPGACDGLARFAFVLTSEGARTAYPFVVDCAAPPPEDVAVPDLLTAFGIAESGDAAQAVLLWDQAMALAGGPRLLAWLQTLAEDPRDAYVLRRPAVADVLVWDGVATTWWHEGAAGARGLSRRDGLWVVDGPHLWRWDPRSEPWTAPAGGGCAAGSGERQAATLVDTVGGERVDVPFADAPRGGSLTPRQYAAGAVTVVELSSNDGCGKPGVPLPRTVRLPGDRRVALAPDWAAATVAGAAGYSVVTEAPWQVWQAFTAGVVRGSGEGGAVVAPVDPGAGEPAAGEPAAGPGAGGAAPGGTAAGEPAAGPGAGGAAPGGTAAASGASDGAGAASPASGR
jgi:hypothetical protein